MLGLYKAAVCRACSANLKGRKNKKFGRHMDSAILAEISQGRVVLYAIVAGFVVLVYDILITLEDEIRLIWGSGFSLTKCLYFINRYAVPLGMIVNIYFLGGSATPMTNQFCYGFVVWSSIYIVVEAPGVIGILITLRLYALYKNTRHIRAFLSVLYMIYVVPPVTLIIVDAFGYYKGNSGAVGYNEVLDVCALEARAPHMWSIWVSMAVFETIAFLLIMQKTVQALRTRVHTPVLAVVHRDGLLYYAVRLAGQVLNIVFYATLPNSLFSVYLYPNWCIGSLIVSRIYLNLRDAANSRETTVATARSNRHGLDERLEAARRRLANKTPRGMTGAQDLSSATDTIELVSLSNEAPV